MFVLLYLEEALRVLFANAVRSVLTMIGLIIGVGAVIAIQTLGASMAGAINGSLGSLADNTFFVFANATQSNYSKALIKLSDLPPLAALPNVTAAVPLVGANDLIRHGHRQARYFITGDTSTPFNSAPVQEGRHLSEDDITHRQAAVVITNKAYVKLFAPGEEAIGQSIYVGPHRYTVIGVLTPPKTGLLNGQFGGDIYAPYTIVIDQYVRGSKIGAVRLVVNDASQMAFTELAVIKKLRQLRGDENLQYNSFDKAQLTGSINGIFSVVTIVVGLIGAVSLLVAGIGVANIMLVSVTERTREIGLRKAVGARSGQVLMQFLIEALMLCGIGCTTGMVLGLGVGAFVNSFYIVKLTGYIAPVPWLQSILITATFAIVVTLAFGTYPAFRAAALDPIEALRYE